MEGSLAAAPAIVAIGASTGGPQALVALLSRLAPMLRRDASAPGGRIGALPVCVTLHMPRDLMPVIATYIAKRCRVATSVVGDPCRLGVGRVYFAPGDRHLGFEPRADGIALVPLTSPERRKSAVDAMFVGAAAGFGPRVLGTVLSGMGEDGVSGSRAVVAAGGTVLAPDRVSSAVWGMPGAVVQADLAHEVIGRVDGRHADAAPPCPASLLALAGRPTAGARR